MLSAIYAGCRYGDSRGAASATLNEKTRNEKDAPTISQMSFCQLTVGQK